MQSVRVKSAPEISGDDACRRGRPEHNVVGGAHTRCKAEAKRTEGVETAGMIDYVYRRRPVRKNENTPAKKGTQEKAVRTRTYIM